MKAEFKRKGGGKVKLVVGMTGATGAIFGVRLLQWLKAAGVETHLVVSPWANVTIKHETGYTLQEVEQLATYTYSHKDQAAAISSGSFDTDGMIVAPCSMKSLASIRTGMADNPLLFHNLSVSRQNGINNQQMVYDGLVCHGYQAQPGVLRCF